MRVAVIGAGKIGGTIGGAWQSAGHDVVYGVRDPGRKEGARPVAEALKYADVVLLAIPGDAVVGFVREHAKELDGKTIIDATNNFRAPAMNSWSEIAPLVPKAALYRAFNTYGFDVFAQPEIGGERPDLFYAGPDGPGQEVVDGLVTDAGCRPVWVGGQDSAGVVDGVLRLWFTLAQRRGRRIGFRLLSE